MNVVATAMTSAVDRTALRAVGEQTLREALTVSDVVRLCPWCGSDAHGRPVALGSGAHVSLSYAPGLVVVAWTEAGPVGIDVEPDGPPVDGVGDRHAWTRTEASLKATGEGLHRHPGGRLDVSRVGASVASLTLPRHVGTVAVLVGHGPAGGDSLTVDLRLAGDWSG